MDERRKQMWVDLVNTFLGEDCVAYVIAHPHDPEMEIEAGAVVLNEIISEEEKFLYHLIPSEKNCQRVLASSVDSISVLWDLWWVFVSKNHHIYGTLGIRKGWVLVQPNIKNPLDSLIEQFQKSQQVAVGKFEFKKPEDKDLLS